MPNPNPVTVTVTLAGNVITVDKDPVVVKWRNNEEVVWTCPQGNVKIQFNKHGNPFHPMPPNASAHFHSGLVKDRTVASYRYSITVTPNAGGPDVHLDPMVDVDDG